MRRGLMVTAAVAAVIVSCSGVAGAATGWTIQATPEPAGTSEGHLQGVSCVSATRGLVRIAQRLHRDRVVCRAFRAGDDAGRGHVTAGSP